MTKDELEMIQQRSNQVAGKKWGVFKVTIFGITFYDVMTKNERERPTRKHECVFIAHAQSDIPRLLEHIKNLESLLSQYQSATEDTQEREVSVWTGLGA